MKTRPRIRTGMAAVSGMAAVTVRSAVRSRLFLFLMVVLGVTVIGLPLAVKGDGTAVGRVRILISYTLGMASLILGVATLWNACGAVSLDKENRTLRMIAVKPVGAGRIWIGKWLGLVALNAVLLAFTGLVMVGFVRWTTQAEDLGAADRRQLREELLTGRRVLHPLEAASNKAIEPGELRRWTFELPCVPRSACFIRFAALTTRREAEAVSGTWRVGPPDEPDAVVFPMSGTLEGVKGLRIPPRAARGGRRLTVAFANGPADRSVSVLIGPDKPVVLLVPGTSFENNLMRALLVVLGILSVVAALGVTAGTLFSFPVATFTGAAILLMAVLAHTITLSSRDARTMPAVTMEAAKEAGWVYRATETLAGGVKAIVDPALSYDPYTPLGEGTLVSWPFTAEAMAVLCLLYPGILGCVGALVLRFKEVAG